MEKIDCNIIRDLLPLYEDNVASKETQELVRAHLADCPDCREELRKMRTPISLPPDEDRDAVKRFLEYQAELRRKQRGKIIRFVAIAAAIVTPLLLILLWYTRPMTLEQLCPEIKLDECRGISGYYSSAPHSSDLQKFSLSPEDPAFSSLMEQVRGRTFRRSLLGLLSQGGRSHTGGGVIWDVCFDFEDVPLSDGSTGSGTLLILHNFFGTVDISFLGDTWKQVSTTEKGQWLTDVFNIISGENG